MAACWVGESNGCTLGGREQWLHAGWARVMAARWVGESNGCMLGGRE